MTIYTKKGDDGTTGLLYGGRVPKDAERPTAYGEVDEAQAFLGLVRAEAGPELAEIVLGIQRDLWDTDAEEPWHRLANPWSESIRYWWRGSPNGMVPSSDAGRVGWDDPAIDVPGMANLILSFDGRLLGLRAMPSRMDLADGAGYDWGRAFTAAGLDLSAFEEVEPEFLHA